MDVGHSMTAQEILPRARTEGELMAYRKGYATAQAYVTKLKRQIAALEANVNELMAAQSECK